MKDGSPETARSSKPRTAGDRSGNPQTENRYDVEILFQETQIELVSALGAQVLEWDADAGFLSADA